jgi:hypothetical protein
VIDEDEKSEALEEMKCVTKTNFGIFSRGRGFIGLEIAFNEGSPAPQSELG